MTRYNDHREFMKANFGILDGIKTDKQKGLEAPHSVKPHCYDNHIINLPEASDCKVSERDLLKIIENRRSIRKFSKESLTIEELSYLLWATSKVQKLMPNGMNTFRPAPSGGGAHPFETYLIINDVEGIEPGIYRYRPMEHQLSFIKTLMNPEEEINTATPKQPFAPNFVSKSAVIFIWSCIPYRAEYKFDLTAHKKILIDVGHLCQNLYLAGESIDCGTCAIGIYDQELVDSMIQVDGQDEFTVYLAAVGKKIQPEG